MLMSHQPNVVSSLETTNPRHQDLPEPLRHSSRMLKATCPELLSCDRQPVSGAVSNSALHPHGRWGIVDDAGRKRSIFTIIFMCLLSVFGSFIDFVQEGR